VRSTLTVSVVLVAAVSLFWALAPPLAVAQGASPVTVKDTVASLLTVEWHRTAESWRRPGIDGYVANASDYRVGGLRLRVEGLDGSDRVVGETLVWVYGNIPARGRWPFTLPLPREGETFRITVESFYLVSRESREAP
jgi:hypothetical protein